MNQPLSESERARGRRLAVTSHPAGMTFYMVFTQQLPTLALVQLGASETAVGIQNSFMYLFQLLQLPALRAVERFPKRAILIAGQLLAIAGALPLVFYGWLSDRALAVPVALASFAVVAIGLNVTQVVWFPLLRGYTEPERLGRFFGTLRSGWHLALIVYYVGAQRWMLANPGAFGPLFLLGFLAGALRIALVWRLPERSERTGERILAREALALVRDDPLLRRYLVGVTWSGAVRMCVVPFAIVMLRREVGFSDADIIFTTVAWYAGGLVSLYGWGRLCDRVGPAPLFLWTSLGMGALILGLRLVEESGTGVLVGVVAFFFLMSALQAGFGVADTHVLFRLTPDDAPARTLVATQVTNHVIAGLAPIVVGFGLERMLASAAAPLAVYHAFFGVAAVLQAASFWPLRQFRA